MDYNDKRDMNKNLITIVILAAVAGAFFFIKYNDYKEPEVAPSPAPKLGQPDPAPVIKVMTHPTLGKYLTDSEGITLYVFAKDQIGGLVTVSNCLDTELDDCSRTWPPYIYEWGGFTEMGEWKVDSLNKKIELYQRPTYALQFLYNRQPLYYYIGDEKPGDVNGHGLDGVWSVVFLED